MNGRGDVVSKVASYTLRLPRRLWYSVDKHKQYEGHHMKKQTGFTIVELLIVIVVIGILAAITIVAFNGIQDRANDTAVQSDLASIAKKLEIYKATVGSEAYPAASAAILANVDISASKSAYMIGRGNLYYCASATLDGYAIGAVSKSGNEFSLRNGTITPDSGIWGSTTCQRAGHASGAGTFASGYAPEAWQAWVKG